MNERSKLELYAVVVFNFVDILFCSASNSAVDIVSAVVAAPIVVVVVAFLFSSAESLRYTISLIKVNSLSI